MHTGHRERVREKITSEGIEGFKSHEMLEYLLYSFVPQKDTNPLAHKLVNKFGSLAGVFDAPLDELQNVEGMPKNAAIFLTTFKAFMSRYQQEKLTPKPKLDTFTKASQYLHTFLSYEEKEQVYMLCLNARNELIKNVCLSVGTVDTTSIYVREVSEAALRTGAVNVVLAHNHPSGSTYPSTADIDMTGAVYMALRLINVTLLDHIIVAGTESFSFRLNGEIKELKNTLEQKLGSSFFERNYDWSEK